MDRDNNYNRMLNTNPKKLVSTLAIPTIISMLVTSIYNLADTFFVSSISDSAGAAITVAFSLQTLIQAIGFTIGMGSGSLISKHLGRRDYDNATKTASSGFFLGLSLGIIFSIFGILLNEEIMKLLGATETSLENTVSYTKWIFFAIPFMISSFVMNNVLRSEGKAKLSMIGLTFGSILNIGLDPIFIKGLDMGISGAGLATMISQIVSFLILISFFIFHLSSSKISIFYISKKASVYLNILKIGSPTLFRQGFASISSVALNYLGGAYSDALLSAIGITNKIYMVVRNIVIGIGQGYQPVLGFNHSAKRNDRVKEAFKFTLFLQTIVCAVATMIVLILPSFLVGLFDISDEATKIGIKAIRLIAISLPFLGVSTIVNQSLQVIGRSKSASFLASLRQGLIYIPLIFIMDLSLGELGLCLTQPISDLLTFFITLFFMKYLFKILDTDEQTIS